MNFARYISVLAKHMPINFINKMKFKLYAKDIDDMDIYVRQLDENK